VVGGTTVVAPHPVILPQRPVQLSQLPQLHPSQIVLILRNFDTLPDHLLDLKPNTPITFPSTRLRSRIAIVFTRSTAFFTHSGFVAVMYACRGSSSPGRGCPSFRPTLPSFTLPLPLMMILAPVSFSIAARQKTR
jgi:hypothetical protein